MDVESAWCDRFGCHRRIVRDGTSQEHGPGTVAILVSPADALELQELRALATYRERQARGENVGVPHDEAYRRVFGGDQA
ncbi:hypothetical protein [Streptomyces uncialis]|uniref:hypothetical protein n=1 Tax=Streptomyces uncialis TaxID=1048205 RepID=UPI0037907F9B